VRSCRVKHAERRFFDHLLRRGHVSANPAAAVKELRRQILAPKGMERSDVRKLLREVELRADVRANAIFTFNYTEDGVHDFWYTLAGEWACFKPKVIEKFAVQVFGNLFKMAEYETALNRSKGFRGKNSCGLLNLWTKAVCIDLLARYNHGVDGFLDYMPDLEKVRYKAAGQVVVYSPALTAAPVSLAGEYQSVTWAIGRRASAAM
jgi:hypothetical protein